MSDLTEVSLIATIGLLHVFLYAHLDRVRKERQDQIVAGVIEGISVSKLSRQMMLYSSWMLPVGLLVGTQVVMDFVYLNMADSVSAAGAKRIAYVFVFWSTVGAFVYLVYTPLWLVHLRSILRQAEAD